MLISRIEAAEEIQLLLPEHLPEAGEAIRFPLIVAAAMLAIAIPLCGLRLMASAPPHRGS
jgi:hypothetical protein